MNSQIQNSDRRDTRSRQSAVDPEQGQPFVVPPVDVFENESGITPLGRPAGRLPRTGLACGWTGTAW
jgi:hypothetical protein